MNAPIGYAVWFHTVDAMKYYERGQEKTTARRKLLGSIQERGENPITLASLRALAICGHEQSWPMLVNIKKADSIWAITPMLQALDSKMEDWIANFEDFFYGNYKLSLNIPRHAGRAEACSTCKIHRARTAG